MRVVLFDPVIGGHHIEYASYIVRYLVEQGDEVTFVTWKPDISLQKLNKEGATIRYVIESSEATAFGGNTLRRSLQLFQGIRYSFNLANKWKADIVHHLYLERSELPLYFQMLRVRKRSWKLFGTLFWLYFIHNPQEKVGFPKRLYHSANRWAFGRLLRQKKLNGLFVHTDRIKKELVRLYGDDSFWQRIFVVPDPIGPMKKMPQEAAREYLGLPKEKPIILFFGGLRWDKGPDILLKALPLLTGDWYVVIAGKPEEIGETEIEHYRKRLREPERLITRLEHIPDKDVAYYFAAADAVVLPYRKIFKGTSGVLQHAAAAGKPVIATDTGEVGPIVRQYELGIVVKPESPESLAEGIQEFLAKKDDLSDKVRLQALRYTQANSWRIMAKRVREIYLTAIEG